MRITVFTGNQPRHIALIEALATVADELFAVQECTTVFPGRCADFYRDSAVMRDYFSRVLAAEARRFGRPRPLPAPVRSLSLRLGDLSRLPLECLGDALGADRFVVFGASYIRGPLCDFLVSRRAVNLHMGVSPYYRGSSTNFWALYDDRPELVGATIHLLTAGLDSGPILTHALPEPAPWDAFDLGMEAVRCGQAALVELLRQNRLDELTPVVQDHGRQIRYSRAADFTDQVAAEFLARCPDASQIEDALRRRDKSLFVTAPEMAPGRFSTV